MQENPSLKVVLHSSSGDTDILVLATALPIRVYLDYGKGKLRKGFWLNQVVIEDNSKEHSLDFIHSPGMTVSSFFKKGKKMCWKALKKN